MPTPALRWYESDGTTPLGRLDEQPVGPGETYSEKYAGPIEVKLKNTGGTTLTVTLEIKQVAAYPAFEHLRIATGATAPPLNEFLAHDDAPLEVGVLAPDELATIWVDIVVPVGAMRAYAQLGNLAALGS